MASVPSRSACRSRPPTLYLAQAREEARGGPFSSGPDVLSRIFDAAYRHTTTRRACHAYHAIRGRSTRTGSHRRGGTLKVDYVTMVFPAPSETFASNDVRALQRRGIDISVHALLPKHRHCDRLMAERGLDGVHVTHGSARTVMRGFVALLRRPREAFDLARAIIRYTWRRPKQLGKSFLLAPRVMDVFANLKISRPDVVHVYWGHYPSMVGFLVQRYMPGTVVTMSLAAYDLERRYGVSMPVARRADRVRTLARVNVEAIHKHYGVRTENIVVIPDGLDLDYVVTDQHETDPRDQALGARRVDSKKLISAGSLHAHKKMDDVIRVFAKVKRRHPSATLSILGDGPERTNLQALSRSLGVENDVTFHGHVEHSQVHREMANADIFLFLSRGRGERLPNVVKEAMANRCVCVVSHTPGIEELIPDPTIGFVVDDGLDAVAMCVDDLLSNPKSIAAIARKARAFVLKEFDREESVTSYIRTWRKLVECVSTARHRARA